MSKTIAVMAVGALALALTAGALASQSKSPFHNNVMWIGGNGYKLPIPGHSWQRGGDPSGPPVYNGGPNIPAGTGRAITGSWTQAIPKNFTPPSHPNASGAHPIVHTEPFHNNLMTFPGGGKPVPHISIAGAGHPAH